MLSKVDKSFFPNKTTYYLFGFLAFLLCLVLLIVPKYALAESFELLEFGHQAIQVKQPVACATDSEQNLFICDADLRQITVLDNNGLSLFTFNDNISLPIDITIDGEKVYVLDGEKHSVLIFDTSGNFLSSLGSQGLAPLQFYNPTDILIDNGELYVVDSGNERIQVIDTQSLTINRIFGLEAGNVELNNPTAIAVSGEILYILEQECSYIFTVDKSDASKQTIDLVLNSQRSVDISIFGSDIAISDPANKKIEIHDLELSHKTTLELESRMYKLHYDDLGQLFSCGSTVKTSGSHILKHYDSYQQSSKIPDLSLDSVFNSPYAITADSGMNYFIADSGNERVQVFDKTLKHLYNITKNIKDPVDIEYFGDSLYVLDVEKPSVEIYDSEGVHIKTISLDFVSNPIRLKVIDSDRLLVFARNDLFVVPLGDSGVIMSLNREFLSDPMDIDYNEGIIYILNSKEGEIIFLDEAGSDVYILDIPSLPTHPSDAASMVISDDDIIYISDSSSDRIYSYTLEGMFIESFDLANHGVKRPYSLYSHDKYTLYICFKDQNEFGKLMFPRGTGEYSILVDGKTVEDFSKEIFTYSFDYPYDSERISIDYTASIGIRVSGDIGDYALDYGLNSFDVSFSEGENLNEYMLYVVRDFPEGFDPSEENIEAYIEYTSSQDSEEESVESLSSKTKSSSEITFTINLEDIDANAIRAISRSSNIKTSIREGKIFITFKSEDFDNELPEISLASTDGIIALSRLELEGLFAQKRNMFITLASLVGVAMMLAVYFFTLKYRKRPTKRNYKKIRK